MKKTLILIFLIALSSLSFGQIEVQVSSLTEFRSAVQNSNQNIILEPGTYELEDLPSDLRVIDCSGSNNTIDMTGVRIMARVGSIREAYFNMSGSNNVLQNGAIEDYYQSGLEEVTDFSAYNNDRDNLAYGLRGDPIMAITGNNNLIEGLEMTVKGSFPYGYGSQYGIGGVNTFGLSKRCGILITGRDEGGVGNTLDGIKMYHYAFGHGIFMQTGATETTIKNCYVEGRVRQSDDIYNDTETYDLPYLTDYKFPTGDDWRTLPFIESYDIPRGENSVVYPLSEDGIRSYNNTGSVVVENCTVKQMRGGIRLYLASSATVKNSLAIDCGSGGTNYNLPAGSTTTGSSGNFTYTTLSDFRLSRSRQNIEMTIIPSPNAIGPHNIADILGNNHDITFYRTSGPLDSDEERVIVVYGNNSMIVNETEYTIRLESGTSGNTVISCGPVIDNGSNNVTENTNCDFDLGCNNTASLLEAECFDDMQNINDEGENIGSIRAGAWAKYDNIDLSNMNSVNVMAASKNEGGSIEIRLGSPTGTLVGVVEVENTGGWADYEMFSANIDRINGEQDLYMVFTNGESFLYNIDFFNFSEDVVCENSSEHIEAECFDEMSGIETENCSEGTQNIGYVNAGDWVSFSGVDLTGMNSVKVRAAGKTEGSIIEIRTGSETGDLIGVIPVTNTTGWQTWVTDSVNIESTSGVHDVYMVFNGEGSDYLFNVNFFEFSEGQNIVTGTNDDVVLDQVKLYPNPAKDEVHVLGASKGSYEIFDNSGTTLLSGNITNENNVINIETMSNGVYFIKITSRLNTTTKKIIIE